MRHFENFSVERRGQVPLVYKSEIMQRVFDLTLKFATTDSTVLITGESGTGKELLARQLHQLSGRARRPFVAVNCSAIPEELLESELFGHVRGAFTGASNDRLGRFQAADGGIVFLDEIGEMSPKLQAKMLRVLQDREFSPVGSDLTIRADIRVVAATNRDLAAAMKQGSFREDLFYRLNVLPLALPPLRKRRDDIPVLLAHFCERYGRGRKNPASQAAAPAPIIEPEVIRQLELYPWPGNIREMENLVERLIALNGTETIRITDLPEEFLQLPDLPQKISSTEFTLPKEGIDLPAFIRGIEEQFMLQALKRSRGNKTAAASLLGLNRTTFVERLRRLGLHSRTPQALLTSTPG